MKNKILMCFHTSVETSEWDIGKKLLTAFETFDPRLTPETLISQTIPLGNFVNVDKCEPLWTRKAVTATTGDDGYYRSEHLEPLEWMRRKNVKYKTQLRHTTTDQKNRFLPGIFTLSGTYSKDLDWDNLFGILEEILVSEYAWFHFSNKYEPEIYPLIYQGRLENLANTSVIPKQTRSVKPVKYINSNLADRIEDLGFSIQELPTAYKIRIVDTIHNAISDFENFSERRALLKSLFPRNTFRVTHESNLSTD